MATSHKLSFFLILSTVFSIAFSGCANNQKPANFSTQEIGVATPSSTLPATPTKTSTAPLSTKTSLPHTPSPSATKSPTNTSTATSIPPALVVNADGLCFTGPGEVYGIRTYVSNGLTPSLSGHTPDDAWWQITIPDSLISCWIANSLVTLSGDTAQVPILTPEATPTQVPTETPKLRGLKYYLINPNTGGPFGCGDQLVYFYSGKPVTESVERNIAGALQSLLKVKSKYIDKYYNPIYNAHFSIKGVSFNSTTGRVDIYLNGSIPKPADVCEAKRIHDVMWGTVENFPGVNQVVFWVGPRLLGDLIAVGDR
jgi:hypothetical protein